MRSLYVITSLPFYLIKKFDRFHIFGMWLLRYKERSLKKRNINWPCIRFRVYILKERGTWWLRIQRIPFKATGTALMHSLICSFNFVWKPCFHGAVPNENNVRNKTEREQHKLSHLYLEENECVPILNLPSECKWMTSRVSKYGATSLSDLLYFSRLLQ